MTSSPFWDGEKRIPETNTDSGLNCIPSKLWSFCICVNKLYPNTLFTREYSFTNDFLDYFEFTKIWSNLVLSVNTFSFILYIHFKRSYRIKRHHTRFEEVVDFVFRGSRFQKKSFIPIIEGTQKVIQVFNSGTSLTSVGYQKLKSKFLVIKKGEIRCTGVVESPQLRQ